MEAYACTNSLTTAEQAHTRLGPAGRASYSVVGWDAANV